MRVWGLIDSRVGSNKQTISLAKALSNEVWLKKIEYTCFIAIPNIFKPKKMGINFENSDTLTVKSIDEVPDVLVFCGRRLAGLALYLKDFFFKNFKKKVKIISILNPNYMLNKFFCVILPLHDNKKADNVITVLGALCELDKNKLEEEKISWENRLSNFRKPYIAFMVGGDTKNRKFNSEQLGKLINNISNRVKELGGTLLVSSSRRTSKSCVTEIENNLSCDNYFFKWEQGSVLNPYYGFLTLSDLVIITGESVSMICEALTLKKSVLIYMPDGLLDIKHRNFCEDLIKKGLAKEIKFEEESLDRIETNGINEIERVRDEILLRMKMEKQC
ncbi:MAG: mitochondrial fission ELM1 family protein [Rickettsiales bacterium]|jgi:mitochondrial fission protein ELM1|nr:mitochondrial fission ELM1 family protein [Rickettsiales bacterium]